jgi:hypothetical protein
VGLDAKLEAWGDWGKGWDLQRSLFAMTAPIIVHLSLFESLAWYQWLTEHK